MASAPCPTLAQPQHNLLTLENVASLLPSTFERTSGTVVNITCYAPTYTLVGSPQVACINGSWTPKPPTCTYKPATTPAPTNNTDGQYSEINLDTPRVILIAVAIVFVLILIFLLTLLLYRLCLARENRKDNDTQTSTAPIIPPHNTTNVSTIMPSSWPGYNRAWTYISVDRLIRDIERSRKENPNHSWRDFASISAYSTNDLLV